jgi:hypothetical protein
VGDSEPDEPVDEFAELDLTENEIDAMMADGEPVLVVGRDVRRSP